MEKITKVLIIGSGGLSIGQAGEFDYSGSQAIKALKEEGIKTVLINPNIATVQTSEDLADTVYFIPIQPAFVKQVIEKERPDGILLGFGGQTALNCGIELHKNGTLEEFNVRVLGTPVDTIEITEDRHLFGKHITKFGYVVPKSISAETIGGAIEASKNIGFPVIIRSAFSLGGLGSGFCSNEDELINKAEKALASSPQILIEESLEGWKEIEYEVMRDGNDNCVTVCNMENFDPLGIHTGESIVVCPSQTLNDKEYQKLRSISIDIIRKLGIVGECNVQFALDPKSENYRVIEVNARLSRSSALASKASGYPLAFIAAKVSLGKTLDRIRNPINHCTMSFFEPSLDYVTVKIPRWDTNKFSRADPKIGTSMKSVGEAMAIGRKFEEALQKAVRMINGGRHGLVGEDDSKNLDEELKNPTHNRIFAIAQSINSGVSVEKLHKITKIDKWFLHKIENIVTISKELTNCAEPEIPRSLLMNAKKHGFSDRQIAKLFLSRSDAQAEFKIRSMRKSLDIVPVIKQIDTMAGEFPAKTNYLYLTYNGIEDDIIIDDESIVVLGSGPYSIGSSVEFDWCCVNSLQTLRELGEKTAVINCNPETVSTDYDESDRLYFEELSLERVLDILDKESEKGVVLSFGGQQANNLAVLLSSQNINVLGTSAHNIDLAEDRHKFSKLLDGLNIDQPEWKELTSYADIKNFTKSVGYPVLIRPSYVLSGESMKVIYKDSDLEYFFRKAVKVSPDYPVVATKFISNAKEIEFDAVGKNGKILAYAISEHIENAGVHSGDATLVTPPQKLYLETIRRIKKISKKLIAELQITGPINIQFIAKNNKIKIIECNLRASRTFPFVSKIYKMNFIKLATMALMDLDAETVKNNSFDLEYMGVKAPQFSFTRLYGADPLSGVEMTSTGEVACLGEELEEAFLKAILSTGFKLPIRSILLSTGDPINKPKYINLIRKLKQKKFSLFATKGTAQFYKNHGIKLTELAWPLEQKKPNVLDYIKQKKIDLVINIPKNNEREELSNDYLIRRTSADFSTPLITNTECAILFLRSILKLTGSDLKIKSWDKY